jgi:Domain of unknown function (DUF5069)
MTSRDLTTAPPRSPREELGGLCMLPRMIDIARAKLPGGNIGQYQIGRGMSGLVLAYLGMDVAAFVACVREASNDEEIAARLLAGRDRAELRLLGVRLRRATVADVPPDLRAQFEKFYGSSLPLTKRVFDILEEDDARSFGPR